MEYNISDEPNYGFKRKVSVAQIHIGFEDFVDKCVNLVLTVKYYENDDPPQNIYISFQVYMLGPKLTPSQFRNWDSHLSQFLNWANLSQFRNGDQK